MKSSEILDAYTLLFRSLETIVSQTENKIADDSADPYFKMNVNFLAKSFLINLCCYLESFLKEISHAYVAETKVRLKAAKVPHNLIIWAANKNDSKPKDWKYGEFELSVSRKDIDEELSGNPFKTAAFFRKLGIDVEKIDEFQTGKELINAVVAKRNSIIHHNDSATDISMRDIIQYAGEFKKYMTAINTAFLIASNDANE